MKKLILTLGILAGAAMVTQAGVVLSESFNYPNGNLTAVSGGIWSAHSGAGAQPVQVTNGMARLYEPSSSAEDVNALLAGAPYLSSDSTIALYSSFKMILSNTLPSVSGTYFAHFRGTNTGAATDFGARLFVQRTNTVISAALPDGKFRLAIGNGAAATNASVLAQIDMDLDTNVVYNIVTKFVPSTGISTYWINPSVESDTHATASDPGTAARPNPFNVYTYALRQADAGSCYIYIDDLKVGTSFNDVAGANTAPLISSVADQNIAAGASTGPIAFTVQDAETPAASLTVTKASGNTALVPNANIVLGGSGTNQTVTITPVPGQQGIAVITLTVNDGVNSSFTSFSVKVGAPVISTIANVIARVNTTAPPVYFNVVDPESDALTFYISSSDPTVLPVSGIAISGSGLNQAVSLTPSAGVTGSSLVTISVTDTHNTNSTSFYLTMRPQLGVLFSDNFDYTTFISGTENSLIFANGTVWSHPSSGAGSIQGELQVTNGLVYLSRTNSEDVQASLNGGPYLGSASVVFYSSFTLNFTEAPSVNGNYFYHFKASTTDTLSFRGKLFARTSGAAAGKFRLGVANVVNAPVVYPMDLDLNTTYTVVIRYNASTGETALWVNPYSEQSASAVATDTPGASDVGVVALREDTGIGQSAMGPLKIATSFAEVFTPSGPAPAQEAIQFQISGGNMTLTWNNPGLALGYAMTVDGPFIPIVNAGTPYTVSTAGPAKYFALLKP